MLSKAVFNHSQISRTITAAAQAKDAVRVRSVTQLEQHTFYFKINCGLMQCGPLWN